MEIFFQYTFLFIFGAISGYLIEFFYRSVKTKHAANPGFLQGPYLPIYGFGTVCLHIFCLLKYSFIKSSLLRLFFYAVTVTIALTLIELIAGIIFISCLKIKLWDYSDRRLNFKGLICAKLSLSWGFLGVFYNLLINPWLTNLIKSITGNHVLLFMTGIVYAILLIDLAINLITMIKTHKQKRQSKLLLNRGK